MDAPSGTAQPRSNPTDPGRRRSGRLLLWSFLAVVVAFLVGFGWQWWEARTVRQQLSETQEQLMVERLRIRLGQATLAAQAGDFESARQQMSDFFTRVSEVRSSLPDSVAAITDELLDMRDDVITGLSRANPEYAGILYGMLERFRRETGREAAPVSPTPVSPAAPAEADTARADTAQADTAAPDSGAGG
jgi:cytoskeletal protein RodZ